jgi:phytoene synthase
LRDRELVRLYWPVELRPAFDALFAIDDAMADVVAQSTQPALAAIKLAWWRERLEELDQGKVPAEPRLQAAFAKLLPRGISGRALAELEDGWTALLEETPDVERALNRGPRIFALAGRLIGSDPPVVLAAAGRLYAAGTLQRLGFSPGGSWAVTPYRSVPSPFRRLTGLAVLAKRDLHQREPEGTPGRAWVLLMHRLTGRFPGS